MWDSGAIASDDTALLADAAGRLRAVRQAEGRFLALWAVDHILADALAAALADASADGTPDNHGHVSAPGRGLFRDRPADD